VRLQFSAAAGLIIAFFPGEDFWRAAEGGKGGKILPHFVHFTLAPSSRKRLSSKMNLFKQRLHSMTIAP
jgi:hypothetical protein